MLIKKIVVVALLLLSVQMVSAQTGSTGMAFLRVDVEGRAAAMGGAYTALAHKASGAFWNPAGLARGSGTDLVLSHHVWLSGIAQEYAALSMKSGKHYFSLAVNVFNIQGIEIRGELPTEEPDGVVDALNFYSAFGYARAFGDWRLGIGVKYLYEKYFLHAASGWAVDLGVQKENILPDLDWGLTVQNMGQMSPLDRVATPLPLLIRTGLGYTLGYELFDGNPLASLDLEYIKDGTTAVRLGVELPVISLFSIRAGYYIGSEYTQWTAGLGLNIQSFRFDYAIAPYPYDLGISHTLSVGLKF